MAKNRNKFNSSSQSNATPASLIDETTSEETMTDQFEEDTLEGEVGPTSGQGDTTDVPVESHEIQDEREGESHPEEDQEHEEPVTPYNAEGEDLGDVVQPVTPVVEEVEESEPPAPAFPFTEIGTWSTNELELYISKPENMDIYHSKLVEAVAEHRRRDTTINEAWSVDEATEFFARGTEPARTTKGCYVNDVTRKLRRESSWTTQELESWALGEIQPEGLVTTNGLAVELHNRFSMQISSVDPETVIAHYKYNYGPNKGASQVTRIGQIPVAAATQPTAEEAEVIEQKIKYAGLTEMSQSYIEQTLKTYIDTVRPNRVVSIKTGHEAQRELDTLVHYILKQQDPVAVKSGLDILFKAIADERIVNPNGVFNDTNIFRFAEGISLNGRAQEIHRRLFTLFFAVIDGDESILQQTDIPELIKYLPQLQQSLLLGYLNHR